MGRVNGKAIRKVLTRVHRVAPSLEGRKTDVIEARLKEQEREILTQLQIVDVRLEQWRRAE